MRSSGKLVLVRVGSGDRTSFCGVPKRMSSKGTSLLVERMEGGGGEGAHTDEI